ncbi:hypothetical protein G3M48_010110 [Beauveria asiatica]|uniref:Uncharacterized protein n=1 Tax=Beauveria asiatica TaxID=1069075 RepID=A0AAW0RHZ9_9HYPO
MAWHTGEAALRSIAEYESDYSPVTKLARGSPTSGRAHAADMCLNLPPRILIETANWHIERTKPKQKPGVGGKSASVKVPDARNSGK